MSRLNAKPALMLPLALVLGGCVANYHPAPGQATARVNLNHVMQPEMCLNGEIYRLPVDQAGYSRIPAGQRVVLRSRHYVQGYPASYVCNPSLSLVPQAQGSYYANLELRNDRCRLEVFREDPQSAVGLAHEPSVTPGDRCVLKVMQD